MTNKFEETTSIIHTIYFKIQMANNTVIDGKIKEALPFYEKLKGEWSRKPPNVGKTEELLNALKVFFLLFYFTK